MNNTPSVSQNLSHTFVYIIYLWIWKNSHLEQVEDLFAQVQLKVCVVGTRHVVDEHQAIPLGLKAVGKHKLDILTNSSAL